MTDHAICFQCIVDANLRDTVESEGEPQICEVCGDDANNAFTYKRLGEELEPVIREHFHLGPVRGWEQEGDSLAYIVQMVLGQDVKDEDALVDAVSAAEHYYPGDGEEAFYDNTSLYVRRGATPHALMADWSHLREEIAHRRRFFSESARALFDTLFEGLPDLQVWDEATETMVPVIYELPAGTEVSRARVVRADAELRDIAAAPARELGAPPTWKSSAGRMNATGIVVFYGAMDRETCIAEMRPALGGRVVVGMFRTTRAIRVLDFRRLEQARLAELSYFDPKFATERERAVFLRRLHGMISRPVVPGREDDYLITQTMAEYLAHLHKPPLDGVMFGSVQREGGANIVLFGRDGFEPVAPPKDGISDLPPFVFGLLTPEAKPILEFPVELDPDSAKLFITRAIDYRHDEVSFSVNGDRVYVHDRDDDDFEDD